MTRSKPVTIAQAYERMKLGYSVTFYRGRFYLNEPDGRHFISAHDNAAEATRAYVEITEREIRG